MKTKGCEVWEHGYLAAGYRSGEKWVPSPCIVPDAFWARIKQHATKAGRLDELKADGARLREEFSGFDVEIAMFRLWVGKLGIELPAGWYPGTKLWPWSRGWREELVDDYLAAPVAKREAA
jgi:hypothetical protein